MAIDQSSCIFLNLEIDLQDLESAGGKGQHEAEIDTTSIQLEKLSLKEKELGMLNSIKWTCLVI